MKNITKVNIKGREVDSFIFNDLSKANDVKDIVKSLIVVNGLRGRNDEAYSLSGISVKPTVVVSFNISDDTDLDKFALDIFNWVTDVLDWAMPEGFGVELALPNFYVLKDIKEDKNVLSLTLTPVKREVPVYREC